MGTITKIQPSFSGGELTPPMHSRVDLQKYSTAVRKGRNVIIHREGGISNRPGTRFVARAKFQDKKCRMIGFEFSITQAYAIELGHYYCRFYMNGGQIQKGGVPYEVETPYSESDIAQVKVAQSADVLYIAHPKLETRSLSRFAHDDWVLSVVNFKNGPFMLQNITENGLSVSSTFGNNVELKSASDLFLQTHVGSIFKLKHYMEGGASSKTFTSVGVSDPIKCGLTWRILSHGSWDGKFRIEKSTDNGATWLVVRTFSSKINNGVGDFNANAYGTDDNGGITGSLGMIRVNYFEHNSGQLSVDLTSDAYNHTGIVKIKSVTDPKTAVADVVESVGKITETKEWSEGSWSKKNGYPSCIVFYQDRLVLARTNAEPQTVWMSKTANYHDFGRSSPLQEDDCVIENLASRKMNGIQHLLSIGNILALTSENEWKISPSGGGAITPTQRPDVKCQSYRGASAVEPVIIGNRAIYVQRHGASVRDIGYDFSVDGFSGDEISTFSQHLFSNFEITEMNYQQEPDSIVWANRSDGKLLSCTYMKEQEVISWTWHDTDGEFESSCTISGERMNELWCVVKRGNQRFIERVTKRQTSLDPKEQFFVDCGITYSGVPVNEISGLDHLEGKTVAILADGSVISGKKVTGGKILIDPSASVVHVGLPFVSEVETLNIEVPMADGPLQGKKVKISEITIRFLNSRGGYLSTDLENNPEYYVEVLQRTNEPWGTAIELQSIDHKVVIGGNYENAGRVSFKQIDPLPFTILAIIPTLSIGG